MSIKHVLIAVGTPRANGQVERYNRVITPMLAKLAEMPSKWDRVIDSVEFALNNTVLSATKKTPSELLFGIRQLGAVYDEIRLVLERHNKRELELNFLFYNFFYNFIYIFIHTCPDLSRFIWYVVIQTPSRV